MKYPFYKTYRNPRIPWVAAIPEHWEETQLKINYSIQLGKMLQNGPTTETDEEIPYLRAIHVNWDSVTTEGLPTMWASQQEVEIYGVKNGDLLVCEGGEAGRACMLQGLEGQAILQNALHRVRDTQRGSARFLCYLLEHISDAGWFSILCNKATIAHLTGEKLSAIKMPVPTMNEQRKIADFLDRKTRQIDSLIAKKKDLIEKLTEKRMALITQAVTKGLNPDAPMRDSGIPWLGAVPEHWEVAQLCRIITLQRGVDITKDEQEEGEVPVVSSGGISSHHSTALMKGPGVLVGRKGTAGAVHYIDSDYWPHDTTLYVKEFFGNHPRFVYYLLSSMDLTRFDTGSSNPTVNRNLVHPEKVGWPDPVEQRMIADRLDASTSGIDRVVEKLGEAIDSLTEYRTALITAAVTGKIDVRNVKIGGTA